jgi:mycothiol synthase
MQVRSYLEDDAERAVAFFADSGRLDSTLVPPSAGEWRTFTAQSFNHGARDFLVAEDDERVVGVAMSARNLEEGRQVRNFRVMVHPERRRSGIGAALFDRVVAQDHAGDVTLQSSTPDDWVAGRAFLRKRGFRPQRVCHFLRLDEDLPRRGRAVDIRPYARTAEEDAAWRRLNDAGYAGGPEYSPLSASDLAAMRDEPGFALHFARDAEAIVGMCHVKDFGSEPWINSVVVSPPYRRRGIARALMEHAMDVETRRPLRLSVLEENPGARRLYDDLGFRLERGETTWWREPGDADSAADSAPPGE